MKGIRLKCPHFAGLTMKWDELFGTHGGNKLHQERPWAEFSVSFRQFGIHKLRFTSCWGPCCFHCLETIVIKEIHFDQDNVKLV